MHIKVKRQQQHRIAACDGRSNIHHRLARRAHGAPQGVFKIATRRKLFTQAVQQINRVVSANANAHRRADRIWRVQWNAKQPHHPKVNQHRKDKRQDEINTRDEGAENEQARNKHHANHLDNVQQLAAHQGFAQRRGLRHTTANLNGDAARQFWFNITTNAFNDGLGIAAAVIFCPHHQVQIFIVVVHIRIKIIRLT